MNLQGCKTIVTGGVQGLGRVMVQQLLEKGCQVAVLDRNEKGLQTLKNEFPEVHVFECDLTLPELVEEIVDAVCLHFGNPHVLINNAGLLYSFPLLRIGSEVELHSSEMWDKVIATNLSSVFYMTSCVVKRMVTTRTRGVVVNISSVSARGNAGQSAYSAAKAGVNALTAVWAKELGPMGIRFVAVAPGYSDTPSTHQTLSESSLKQIVKEVPLRRLGRPEEIAQGVIAVIENDFFNGKVVELDGGLIV